MKLDTSCRIRARLKSVSSTRIVAITETPMSQQLRRSSNNISTQSFKTPKEWRSWLTKHHAKAEGIWLRFFKKASGVKSISDAEALDEALCFGWIDGQLKKCDAKSWLQNSLHAEARVSGQSAIASVSRGSSRKSA